MSGESRRPRRNTKSVYARADTGIDDEALEETPLEERRSRRRPTRQQLFPSDDVQDTVQDKDEDEEGQDEEAGDYQHWGRDDFDAKEGGEATQGETASAGSRKVYQRGITHLPTEPIAFSHRPVLRPEGAQ
jgi:hypothetical protein